MVVDLALPPFGTYRTEIVSPAPRMSLCMELANGALYEWMFTFLDGTLATHLVGRLSAIRCLMPPLTPEANPLERGDDARLPMMADGAFCAALEAEQRRTEWAARGVTY